MKININTEKQWWEYRLDECAKVICIRPAGILQRFEYRQRPYMPNRDQLIFYFKSFDPETLAV